MARSFFAALLPLAVAAVGCSTAPPPKVPAPVVQKQPKPAKPQVVGTVLLSTTKKPSPLGGIVFFENSPKTAGALTKADITIYHKKFVPFISVLTAGGTATFSNIDTMQHHIFSPDVKGWDTGILKHGVPVSKTFTSPGKVTLLCNIHQEMLGYLYVIPSTSYGEVSPDGTYEIGGVPPGTYKLTAWVPHAPAMTKPVTVTASGTVTLDYMLNPSNVVRATESAAAKAPQSAAAKAPQDPAAKAPQSTTAKP